MVCRVNTWLVQIYMLYVVWIHDFVKSLVAVFRQNMAYFITLHPPGGMIFEKHDKSRRYLTLMTDDSLEQNPSSAGSLQWYSVILLAGKVKVNVS